MIEVDHVSKRYGSISILNDCSMKVSAGEVVVLCGPSGSGKSTLIKCINGLEAIQDGKILFNGTSVHDRSTDLPALRTKIGMVFQSFELYPHLTLLKNVSLAQRKVLGRNRSDADERSEALLRRVGLAVHVKKYPHQLSGGQQQRGAIARSLAMNPVAMLFDEPNSALDPEMIGEVLDVMISLANEGMTMVVVSHEMTFARKVAKQVAFMDAGNIVHQLPTDQFFSDPPSERVRLFLKTTLSH